MTAKLHGKEKTITVQRSDVDMTAVGTGAAAGAGACLGANVMVGVAGLVFPPCLLASPVGCALLGVGPGVGWYYGHRMPDVVKVDMKDADERQASSPSADDDSDNGERDDGGGRHKKHAQRDAHGAPPADGDADEIEEVAVAQAGVADEQRY